MFVYRRWQNVAYVVIVSELSACFDVGYVYLMRNVMLLRFNVIHLRIIGGFCPGERIVCVLVDCWRHRCCQFDPVDCILPLRGIVKLTLRYTTPDVRCRHRRYECDGGIRKGDENPAYALMQYDSLYLSYRKRGNDTYNVVVSMRRASCSIVHTHLDFSCNPKKGTFSTVQMLIDHNVDVVFGPMCSGGRRSY